MMGLKIRRNSCLSHATGSFLCLLLVMFSVNFDVYLIAFVACQGEVEDTRLRPRTALPRTDPLKPRTRMLEAKDTGASVVQKKVFNKIFQAIYNIFTIPGNF